MKIGLLIGMVTTFSLVCLSQGQQITSAEFWPPIRDARQKARSIDRRKIQKIENYKDGKLISSEEWRYEYLLPDRIRYVHTESSNGKTTRTEEIDIGKQKYCKFNEGEWKVSTTYCIGGSGSGGPSPMVDQYTIDNTKLNGQQLKRYRHFFTFKRPWLKGDDSDLVFFEEMTDWINNDGLIVREEMRIGRNDPMIDESKTVETYEYNPKDLKIEAPIKP